MNQVVDKLKSIIAKTNLTDNDQNNNTSNIPNEKSSQAIQNSDQMNTKEIESKPSSNDEPILSEKNLNMIIDEIVDLIFKEKNKGIDLDMINQQINNYVNSQSIALQEIVNWLSNNQKNSNAIFLLGYFNLTGVEINANHEEAFDLFINASKQNHILAQFYVGSCYKYGYGITKDEKLACKYYEKIANQDSAIGQFLIGYHYNNGVDVDKDINKAIYWYEKAASSWDYIRDIVFLDIVNSG